MDILIKDLWNDRLLKTTRIDKQLGTVKEDTKRNVYAEILAKIRMGMVVHSMEVNILVFGNLHYILNDHNKTL